MKFCNFELKNRYILAPMAGITDQAYRITARSFGASLCYSEMISAKALCYGDKKTRSLIDISREEGPFAVQLFGAEPEFMVEGAKIIEDMGYEMIDINCGCPAPKIFNNGEGSALMRNPSLIEKIVSSVTASVRIPVTVKMRKGIDENLLTAIDCAKAAESGGASAVTVHGRLRNQFYSGKSDTSIIREVNEALKIPVIANGDVFTPEDAAELRSETGCDFIMVARGSMGKPFLFTQLTDYEATGKYESYPTEFILKVMLSHIELMVSLKGEERAIKEARKLILHYVTGFRNAARLRCAATAVNTLNDVIKLKNEIEENIG